MLSTDKQTDKQTNKQTDKLTNATKNITSFAKELTSACSPAAIISSLGVPGPLFIVCTSAQK